MAEAQSAPASALPARVTIGVGSALLAGGALGLAAWASDQLTYPWSLLLPTNTIGAWLAVAFALGAIARTAPTGALRGAIGLVAAVGVYYGLVAALGEGIRVIGASHAAIVWGLVAVIAGPVMGACGAVWRHGTGWPRALALAPLAAGLIAEGLVFGATRWLHPDQLPQDPGAVLLAVEVIVGAVLPFILLRRGERLRGYLATAAVAVVAALALDPISTLVRSVADRF